VIPCLPYDKDISGIQYKSFIDYKTDTTSDKLPLPSKVYWYTLEDVLTQYVRHDDHKFDYDNEGIAHRKHIIADRIRYIGKETNNLDETQITGVEDDDYIEYENLEEFKQWTLTLKPKDVRDYGISKMALWKIKDKIKQGKLLNPKTKIVRKLIQIYKSIRK
ncbi:MAG: hypothetical protein ACP5RZ_04100, partial [Thermoplasmata archaeon]